MAFDLTALQAYVDEISHANDIKTDLIAGNESAPHLMQLRDVKSSVALPAMSFANDIVQARACNSTFGGNDLTISQAQLDVQKLEVFEEFCVQDLEAFYTQAYLPAGTQYDGLGSVESMILSEIVNRTSRAIECITWEGELGGANPIAQLNLVDGFNHRLDDAIVATTVAATSTGAITSANALGFVEGLVNAAVANKDTAAGVNTPGEYKIFMGHDAFRAYDLNYRTVYGDYIHANSMGTIMVQGTQVQIVPVAGLNGTDYMHMVRNMSLVQGNDLLSEQTSIIIDTDQYRKNVWVRASFNLGFAERAITEGFYHTA